MKLKEILLGACLILSSHARAQDEPAPNPDDALDQGCDTSDDDASREASIDPEPTDSPAPGEWKPKYHTFKGEHDYICLAMRCKDGPPVSVAKCGSLAKGIASFYKSQSHGKLIFHPRVEVVSVNQPYGPKCGAAVSDLARRKWGKALFALPRPYYHGNSNAGMRLANLTGYGNAAHETGHLLGLGHAGRYNGFDQENGKFGKLESYGDGGATMSGLRGGNIRPSQAIRLGWAELGKDYAVYDGKGRQEFTLRKETNVDGRESGLQTLVIPAAIWNDAGEGRDMYVDFSQNCTNDPCIAVYLAANGGSQRLGIMGGEFHYTPSGLKVTRLGGDSHSMKISVEVVKK